ncbi:VWA domain-containing protein [Agitococcus lubricus]|uniref:Stress response protein SCP2 n=1 Tax=Agitococcus lubricus TaxID=1077255 RepID=A0A2T5J2L6_9GAMM|nr:VWA domain-containing protein [Agitococcus lubricus]PTQ90761.1 stress response protein SCP2 [Agitococcus lubricus]
MDMIRGQKLKISDMCPTQQLDVYLQLQSALTIDISCFGLDSQGKLSDERYMTFFNQPQSPCGGVTLVSAQAQQTHFRIDLSKLPNAIDKLVFTAAIDGQGTMSQLQMSHFAITTGQGCRFSFSGQDFAAERALMVAELYRKDGIWRVAAIGQGFNGGLAALVTHFGGQVADTPAPTKPHLTKRVQLEKRIEQEAPQLVNLVKKAQISLEKSGLSEHRAKVCLCLDISASMSELYNQGKIQAFVERILALACRFDDDGEVDVFLFGEKSHHAPTIDLRNYQHYIRHLTQQYRLEFGTDYAPAMKLIRRHYLEDDSERQYPIKSPAELPIYVMFVTDGATGNRKAAEKQMLYASYQPIFWQFMGIGRSGAFEFLEKLDDLTGRYVDNADFFSVKSPQELSDEQLFARLMNEYPKWLAQAQQKNLLHRG